MPTLSKGEMGDLREDGYLSALIATIAINSLRRAQFSRIGPGRIGTPLSSRILDTPHPTLISVCLSNRAFGGIMGRRLVFPYFFKVHVTGPAGVFRAAPHGSRPLATKKTLFAVEKIETKVLANGHLEGIFSLEWVVEDTTLNYLSASLVSHNICPLLQSIDRHSN